MGIPRKLHFYSDLESTNKSSMFSKGQEYWRNATDWTRSYVHFMNDTFGYDLVKPSQSFANSEQTPRFECMVCEMGPAKAECLFLMATVWASRPSWNFSSIVRELIKQSHSS